MSTTIDGVVLDHVAVAVEHWPDAWPRYATELGGRWVSGGLNVGFAPAQLRYAGGGRVEVLQPWRPEDNPFLRRFLDRHGPGPHHLTFKVPDIEAALALAGEAGFDPVGVDLSHEEWMEAFLHPRQATGIVVQLAQAAHAWASPPPEGFPAAGPGAPASLVRATHVVADLDLALGLFARLLGGRPGPRATGPDGTWECVDLTWAAPPVLRLVAPVPRGATAERPGAPPPVTAWLGGRPGRLHHLAFAADGPPPARPSGGGDGAPSALPGVLPADDAWGTVAPQDNLGTRLVLVRPAGSLEDETSPP
ncbi:MAG TPA: VOC family protein [Acidimicrobiales bacterium]|nr:VOC family protein [Acidimicrobiales bacterium]